MTDKIREDILQVVEKAIAAADPAAAAARCVSLAGSELSVGGRTFDLSEYEHMFVLGAGKASEKMAQAVEHILQERLTAGIISTVPRKAAGRRASVPSRLEIIEAEHPFPGAGSITAAERAIEMAGAAGGRDLIICLISGGASSLWSLPVGGIDLEEKSHATRLLLASGANIHEINTIRKHISRIKGGGLARAAHPAAFVTLAISDVVGDELSSIGSGPTVADPTTFDEALAVIDAHRLGSELPPSVLEHLRDGAAGRRAETPKPGDPIFTGSVAVIAASNRLALEAAAESGRRLGYHTRIVSSAITGEAREAGWGLVENAALAVYERMEIERPAMLISGGETTVTVRGRGKGGRNQELALSAAIVLAGREDMVIASVGTDGIDGTTDAAGAFADVTTLERAAQRGIDADAHLEDNDSYAFFGALGDLIQTGPTGTNVMDIQVIVCL